MIYPVSHCVAFIEFVVPYLKVIIWYTDQN